LLIREVYITHNLGKKEGMEVEEREEMLTCKFLATSIVLSM